MTIEQLMVEVRKKQELLAEIIHNVNMDLHNCSVLALSKELDELVLIYHNIMKQKDDSRLCK